MGTLDFSRRSEEPEIMDDMTLGGAELARILDELRTVNRLLGGYATTLSAIERLVARDPEAAGRSRPLRILDVGAGGGDMARALLAWGERTRRDVRVVGVDLNESAVRYARDRLAGAAGAASPPGAGAPPVAGAPRVANAPRAAGASLACADVFALPFGARAFDVSLCSLFLHHFPQPSAARVLTALYGVSRLGVVVNDLHRHPLAHAGFRAFARLMRFGRIVRHDGALSVMRAFTRRDLEELSAASGLRMEVAWRWAFRYQIVIRRGGAIGGV